MKMNTFKIPAEDTEIKIIGWGVITITKISEPNIEGTTELAVHYKGLNGGCGSVDSKGD